MKAFLKKLTSRKFITCIAGIVMGLCIAFGIDEGAVSTIAGAITSIVSIVAYIFTEGELDAMAIKDAVDKIEDAIIEIEGIDDTDIEVEVENIEE